MKAILLAAGLGTRLRPITNDIPKCLVEIGDKPLLGHWLDLLFAQGLSEVLINTHYRSEMVEQYIANNSWKDKITLAHEERLLGTGGTIARNRSFIGNGPVLAAHADNFAIFDLADFWRSHSSRSSEIAMTMMTFVTDRPQDCGVIECDAYGTVTGFHEKAAKPPGNLANAAVYLIEPEIVEFISRGNSERVDFAGEVIPEFLGRIATYRTGLYLRDIGTPESLAKARQDFNLMRIAVCPG